MCQPQRCFILSGGVEWERMKRLLLTLALALTACAPLSTPGRPNTSDAAPAPRLPGMTSSAFVELAGERVYYESGGSGSPVLMIHGIGAGNSSHLWRNNTLALSREHRVYAFDFPGFARSGARAGAYTNDLYVAVIEGFIKTVIREPVMIVAGSYGADYAIRLAAEQPALITRLLLSNPSGYGLANAANDNMTLFGGNSARDEARYKQFAETPLGGLVFNVLDTDGGLNFFLNFYVYLDANKVTPELTKVYRDNLSGPNKAYAPFSFFSGLLSQPAEPYWPRLTQPTHLVWGTDDLFTPITQASEYLERRPVPFTILRARAIPYDEVPDKFNAVALKFLAGK
jgi:pimeloyl-ACP methyl ester carboxylesterase